MLNDDDNVLLEDYVKFVPYTIPGENYKDIPINFSKCGIYNDMKNIKLQQVPLNTVIINRDNVIIDGGELNINTKTCINIIGKKIKESKKYLLTDNYYPSGSAVFNLNISNIKDNDLRVGDEVLISYKTNNKWITKLNMSKFWKNGITMNWFSKISEVQGNQIKLDIPITYGLNKEYGDFYLAKYTNNRIKNIIIRNIKISTSLKDEGTIGIYLENCENVLIENVETKGFDRGIKISDGANHITVNNCIVYEANTPVEGGNRYAYEIDAGNNCLIQNCKAYKSRHPYAGGGRCCGPHVFYNCQAIDNMKTATSQPHRLWGNGFLYDNIIESNGIDFENREDSGSGHGWAAANCIAWNCDARMVCENPPTARNFFIGCTGGRGEFYKGNKSRPMHTIISEGKKVEPRSLFIYQSSL